MSTSPDAAGSSEPAPTAGRALAHYYDRLAVWTRLARAVGFGGGSAQLTVHRLLADPRAGGRATPTRLHDVIAEALPRLHQPRILDAGCGLGGTMLDLVVRYDGTAVGLTLSPAQAARAREAAAARGLSSRVEVRVETYDAPPAGPFDLIVAIESLAHSPDPGRSLAALASTMAPGGRLVIVDDMPEPEAAATGDLARFQRGWQAPVLWRRDDYLAAFERLGLVLDVEKDLSAESPVRTLAQISRMERLNRALVHLVPSRWRTVFESYYGGLALERLYRRRLMRYCLLSGVR